MKSTFLLLLVSLLPAILQAQYPLDHKRDRQWLFGFTEGPEYGYGILDFNSAPPVTVSINQTNVIGGFVLQGIVCDTSGIINVYCSNGHKLVGPDYLELPSTPRLDYARVGGGLERETCIILPFGDGSKMYYVIHSNEFPHWPSPDVVEFGGKGLRFGVVDMDINNGRGGALFVDSILVNDTLIVGGLVACRHANGRDWWILTAKKNESMISRFLVTPYGISLQGKQRIEHPILYNTNGQTSFSPDGTRFATFRVRDNAWLDIFRFDRCTGLLSSQLHHEFNALYLANAGCSFSPNSQRLYFSSQEHIFQLNLELPDSLIMSNLDTVALYDGFIATYANGQPIHATGFQYHQLGPNNKIYLSAQNTNYLHTIHNPDALGRACDVRQHDVRLPTINSGTMPNYPNYRLGPIDGSACDTLGIDVLGSLPVLPPGSGVQVRLYPNPTGGIVQFVTGLGIRAQRVLVYDVLGRIVQAPVNLQVGQVDLSELADGVYILEIQAAGKVLAREKVVKQGN